MKVPQVRHQLIAGQLLQRAQHVALPGKPGAEELRILRRQPPVEHSLHDRRAVPSDDGRHAVAVEGNAEEAVQPADALCVCLQLQRNTNTTTSKVKDAVCNTLYNQHNPADITQAASETSLILFGLHCAALTAPCTLPMQQPEHRGPHLGSEQQRVCRALPCRILQVLHRLQQLHPG